MLLERLCVFSSIPEAKGPKAQVWREREWCFIIARLQNICCSVIDMSCKSCCSLLCCVFPQGPVLLHCVCKSIWASDKKLLCQSIFACSVSSLPLLNSILLSKKRLVTCYQWFCPLSFRICVPGGFMLATVLGCVCLGIASLIYLAVSW